MNRAAGRASVANAFNITGGWVSSRPVFFRMMWRRPGTARLNDLLRPIRNGGDGKGQLTVDRKGKLTPLDRLCHLTGQAVDGGKTKKPNLQ